MSKNTHMVRKDENLKKQEDFQGLIEYFSARDEDSTDLMTKKKLKVFSEIIPSISFSLYDDEQLVKKYPGGFVTESLIGIPIDVFDKVKEKTQMHAADSKDYHAIWGDFFVSYVSSFLENKFSSEISQNDKKKALGLYLDKSENNEFFKYSPTKLTTKKLLKDYKEIDSDIKDFITKSFKEKESIFNVLLSVKSITADFPTIQTIWSLDKREIRDNNGKEASNFLDIMTAKIESLIKNTKNLDDFLMKAEKNIFPIMLDLPKREFFYCMIEMDKGLFRKRTDNYTLDEMLEKREELAKKVNSLELSDKQRTALFDTMSGYNPVLAYDVKTPFKNKMK